MAANGNEDSMKQINGKQMRSTEEAADYLGMSSGTLRFWRHLADGTGPKSFRVGKKLVYYAQEDLDEWLSGQYEGSVTA